MRAYGFSIEAESLRGELVVASVRDTRDDETVGLGARTDLAVHVLQLGEGDCTATMRPARFRRQGAARHSDREFLYRERSRRSPHALACRIGKLSG
jgi:hypothetical protein